MWLGDQLTYKPKGKNIYYHWNQAVQLIMRRMVHKIYISEVTHLMNEEEINCNCLATSYDRERRE